MAVVNFEQQGPVAWITINRPEKANTLVRDSFVALADAWNEIEENRSILVAVLTAAGTKDFCCGGDLQDFIPKLNQSSRPSTEEYRDPSKAESLQRALLLDKPLLKPIIAAINGRALGGGVELIEATDIRIASNTATFGLLEPRVGIVPGAGSLVRLPRQISYAHAMYMLLTAQIIDAETALRFGLISEIVAPDRLHDRAQKIADLVVANAPLSMRAIKKTVFETHTLPWDTAHAIERANTQAVSASDDAKEGSNAFAEKRKPDFLGR
jgi:enoyl-CoA hydratase